MRNVLFDIIRNEPTLSLSNISAMTGVNKTSVDRILKLMLVIVFIVLGTELLNKDYFRIHTLELGISELSSSKELPSVRHFSMSSQSGARNIQKVYSVAYKEH